MTQAAPAPALEEVKAPQVTDSLKTREKESVKLLKQPEHASEPVASLPARTSATANISMTSRGVQAALPPAVAPAAAALLPAPKNPVQRQAGRSDTQVEPCQAVRCRGAGQTLVHDRRSRMSIASAWVIVSCSELWRIRDWAELLSHPLIEPGELPGGDPTCELPLS